KFIQKFYVNELIKGLLLFFAIGLLYFIFTLLIEYFLWLKPLYRTLLFWLFILVELVLLIFYVAFPIVKILGITQGINKVQASKIIGNHFPEVRDKLLNIIQLKNSKQNSELIIASIEQKSKELKPIPFIRAVDFTANKKYIKYVLLPVIIWLTVYFTGNTTIFNDSFSRVVHYKIQFAPPAPFSFNILNNSLNVIEGEPFTLLVETKGNTVPDEAKIVFENENYYLKNKDIGNFEYNFTGINKSIHFYLEANGVISELYKITVTPTPVITNLKMVLNYPNYTGKNNKVVKNTGNTIVPEGTNITWQVETHQTNKVILSIDDEKFINFTLNTKDHYSYSKQLLESINYKISTSNKQLVNYESLNFTVQVIPDEYPTINVESDIDSVSFGSVQFIGQLGDDYGLKKLQLIYFDKSNQKQLKKHQINIPKSTFTDFYYVFPEGISIEKGIEYEFYFEVFDNDAVNGSKKTKSKKFRYYNKTDKELKEELLNKQKEEISNISKLLEKSKKVTNDLEKFNNQLQKKATIDWNDSQKLEQFLKRQNQYHEMFQRQTNQLDQNLKELPVNINLKEKKEALKKRIEETKKLVEQNKILKQLNELAKKLEKEDLINKLKEYTKKNKQNQKSLKRILELTKRFYVEQKANQIADKLNQLATKQDTLSYQNKNDDMVKRQQKIKEEFEDIKKEIEDLTKQNNDLERPMNLPNNKQNVNDIDKELDKVKSELSKKQNNNAKNNQRNAAKKMRKLSQNFEQSMNAMEGEQLDENIGDLRKIVENLIEFSFQQENLLNKFSEIDNNHPEYSNYLKRQYVLKEYFEHIDDSLYVLSLRLVKMGGAIQKEVSNVHYYIDKSLINFSENNTEQGVSDEHFTLTSVNNLANQLSNLLESLMNATPSMGKGKGGSQEFSLPDIIKKQGELSDKIKKGLKKGDKEGEKNGKSLGEKGEQSNEQLKGELYQIYKEQELLRQALKKLFQDTGKKGDGFRNVEKKMEELEKELLDQGFSQKLIENIQRLNYELLKLDKATLKQGNDIKRKSEENYKLFNKRKINKLNLQNQYFNYNEILNRQSLPLQTIYKKKVLDYFKNSAKKNDSIQLRNKF
ncbi:liver stage antigen, putative, partial [hydrothermal vent metagenome]